MSQPKPEHPASGRAKHLAPSPHPLLELFEGLFEPLLRKVVREELDARMHPSDDWRDQRQDRVLTPRQHCRAARRRLELDPKDPMARKVGDRYLLTTDAIALELERLNHPPAPAAPKAASPEDEARERVARRLRRVK